MKKPISFGFKKNVKLYLEKKCVKHKTLDFMNAALENNPTKTGFLLPNGCREGLIRQIQSFFNNLYPASCGPSYPIQCLSYLYE